MSEPIPDDGKCEYLGWETLKMSQCDYIKREACFNPEDDPFNYLAFYFCTLNSNLYVAIPLALFFLFLVFNFLKTTAEAYLTPALSTIANKMLCSESLAGVTLLALANGAPDIISSVFAGDGDDDEGGLSMAIGSIFGAGVFVTTIVLFRCVTAAPSGSINVTRNTILRDLLFYITAVSTVLVFGVFKEVTWINACVFFGLYALYVIVVIFQEYQLKNAAEDQDRLVAKSGSDAGLSMIAYNKDANDVSNNTSFDFSRESNSSVHMTHKMDQEMNMAEQLASPVDFPPEVESIARVLNVDLSQSLMHDHITSKIDGDSSPVRVTPQQLPIRRSDLYWSLKKFGFRVNSFWNMRGEQFWNLSLFEKFLTIINIPFDFIRDVTIPQSDKDLYHKYYAMVVPFGTAVFLLWKLNKLEPTYLAYTMPPAALISLIVWKTSHLKIMPSYQILFALPGFVLSIMWIGIASELLVFFLKQLEVLTGLPQTFLGLTVLAWGNSAGDFFTNAALTKSGYGMMAVTGCFAGQLFNLLVGFGLTMAINFFKDNPDRKPIPFELYDPKNRLPVIVIGSLLVSLLFNAGYLFIRGWNVGKVHGYTLLLIYLVFAGVIGVFIFNNTSSD